MKLALRSVIAVAMSAVLLSATTFAQDQVTETASASTEALQNNNSTNEAPFNDAQMAALEEIIHSYIVTHPEVLVEAAQMMELRRQVEQRLKVEDLAQELVKNEQIPVRFGDENSKHHVIEFFDYNCGYCKSSRAIVEQFAKENNVKVHYMEFPVLSELSVEASLIGTALFLEDPDKYFVYQDFLMNRPEKLDSRETIKEAVKKAEGDWDKLAEVAKDPKVQKLIGSNIEKGRSIGVSGVPFFIVDGKVLRGAITSVDNFKDLIK